jgi:hypothetical protein
VKIVRDDSFADLVKKQLVDLQRSKRRVLDDTLHVSEILNPRKAYWTRQLGERPTDEAIGFFITGEAFHRVVQEAMGAEFSEVKLHLPGVVGTADLCGVYFSEIKTSRKWTIPEEADPLYIEQLEDYMAMADRPTAYILVIYFTAGRKWDGSQASTLEIASWKLDLTETDRSAIRDRIFKTRDDLNRALKEKRPEILRLCPEWMCGREYKDKRSICPYYEDCKPEGRYPLNVLFPPKQKRERKKTGHAAHSGLFKKKSGSTQARGTGLFKKARSR